MNNLLSWIVFIALIIITLKIWLYFHYRKKQSLWRRTKEKLKFICILILTGMLWIPLTLNYCVKNPAKAIIYAGKMGLSVHRVKKDFKRTLRKIDVKIPTPKFVKKIGKSLKHTYTRFGIRDSQRMATGALNEAIPGLYQPKPSLFERIGTGIFKVVKCLKFWR